jgi:hypothetical protein
MPAASDFKPQGFPTIEYENPWRDEAAQLSGPQAELLTTLWHDHRSLIDALSDGDEDSEAVIGSALVAAFLLGVQLPTAEPESLAKRVIDGFGISVERIVSPDEMARERMAFLLQASVNEGSSSARTEHDSL